MKNSDFKKLLDSVKQAGEIRRAKHKTIRYIRAHHDLLTKTIYLRSDKKEYTL